jgi:exodeoxyribonuclease-5
LYRWLRLNAGTGKSTLIKFIIDALNLNPEDVCYVAFTGKAATVLRQKGCPNAITAHKLLYDVKPRSDGTFMFIPKDILDEEYKAIIVDEISMLPRQMWQQLLRHRVYILACGDPGQLPPVDKDTDNHVLDNPHIFLDEIMRQAQDSEIIRLSMWVREGKPLAQFPCQSEQVKILNPSEVNTGVYNWPDQILCATNAKRNGINNFIRQSKGCGEEPCEGDKIISLHNHWDYFSQSGNWALTNGSIGTITRFQKENFLIPRYIYDKPLSILFTDIQLEDNDNFIALPIDYNGLITGTPTLTPRQQYQLKTNKRNPLEPPFDFAYAYAITVWKAQGSEWNKVLGFEEAFPFDAETKKRYLYTLITRAKEKLVIVKR